MKSLTLTVPVQSGKCQFTEQHLAAIRTYLEQLATVSVTFSKPKSTRSLKQNAYLWVCYGYIAEHTGNTTEDIHIAFRDMLLPRKFIKIGAKELEVAKTTTDLTPTEFGRYVDQVIAEAAQLGIVIPDAS
jgi:hypothetical protein